MSQEKTTLEIIAPTVEEAVQKGLDQLGLPSSAVEVEVLDAGSRGLFGLGSRQARIRLSIKQTGGTQSSTHAAPATAPTVVDVPVEPSEAIPPVVVTTQFDQVVVKDEEAPVEEEQQEAIDTAQQVVRDLLEKMNIVGTVKAHFRVPQEDETESVLLIDIEGDDLSILIGHRSEVLNALQYISSLIIGKRLNRWMPVTLDVQGFRARRERVLRQLARKMADQAVHTGRRQVLEPMPSNERRLIHMELRDHAMVATESTGEEPNRKITIYLKKN